MLSRFELLSVNDVLSCDQDVSCFIQILYIIDFTLFPPLWSTFFLVL